MTTPSTIYNLLDSMLLIQSQTALSGLLEAMHQFKAGWTDLCRVTPSGVIAIRRMNDVFEDTLTELTFTATYLAEHSGSFLQRGFEISLNGVKAAFLSYARFWIGQLAILRLQACRQDHMRFLEEQCATLANEVRDALTHARGLRRSVDSHR
ncbi:hypothetical protein KCV07_g3770, partial [Aureobasidium melanogenum]